MAAPIPCIDPYGKKYDSKEQMCKNFSITVNTYNQRLSYGWTTREALGIDLHVNKKINTNTATTGPNGKTYDSQAAMCSDYNVEYNTFMSRRYRGWSLEQSLGIESITVADHLGNMYSSETEMCEHYGLPISTFTSRLKRGWNLKDALCGKDDTAVYVGLHGDTYTSLTQLCKTYHVDRSVYTYRREHGYSLEDCLNSEGFNTKERVAADGTVFRSLKDMSEQCGVPIATIATRLRRGASVDAAMSCVVKDPKTVYNSVSPEGVEYHSFRAMCVDYGVSEQVVRSRLNSGLDLKTALTYAGKTNPVRDHKNKLHLSTKLMCEYWGISVSLFEYRMKSGWTLERALETSSNLDKMEQDPITGKATLLQELLDKYGIYRDTYNYRIRQNWDLMEVFGLKGRGLDYRIKRGDVLNPAVVIKSSAKIDDSRYYKVLIKDTNQTAYMTADQIKAYPEGWKTIEE